MSDVVFKFIAVGVPALLVLGGILLLFSGNSSGWALIIIGALIYVLEIFVGGSGHGSK